MDKIFNVLSIAAGISGGIAAAIFGACDKLLWALMVIMALDYVTGVIKGVYTKRLSSNIGFKGLLKKVEILVIVSLASVIQEIIGENIAIREIVLMFYIANEGISILENVAAVSPGIPDKLKEIPLQLRGDGNENRN